MKTFIFSFFILLNATLLFSQTLTVAGNPASYRTNSPATITVTYTVSGLVGGSWNLTASCTGCAAPINQTTNSINNGTYMFTFNTPNPAGADLIFGGQMVEQGVGTTISVTQTSTTLDINLISFEAKQEDAGVILVWKVAAETNNDFMAIERSFDGELFHEIGQVKGRGTTQTPFTYNFVDYSASEGVNYYRLRQVDFDKSAQYSRVIAINAPGSNDIFAFPNPAKDKITLQYDYSKGAGNIQLYDALGRRVNASIGGYAGNYEVKLPEGLAKGTYWLKVERSGKVQTLAIVKQ